LKILHFPTSYPDPDRGKPYDCIFVKEHILSVAPYCENRVVYISSDQPSGNKIVEIVTSDEDSIPTDRIYFKTIRPLWITNVYVRMVLFLYFLRLILIKRFYPDILHVHFHQAGLMAMLFCKVFRIKVVVTEHWSAFIGWPALPKPRFVKAAKVFEYAKWVFTVSHRIKEGIEKYTGVNLIKKTSVTLNSVDTKIFFLSSTEIKSEHYEKKILCVARLAEEKDLPILFSALSKLEKLNENFVCEVIGKGDISQFKTQLTDLNISSKVIFLGEQSKSFISTKMREADALVISSFIENSPCVIGEAFCTGLPVVSTHVGGIPELLDDTNGILVPPKDPEQLALALHEALYVRKFNREAISQRAQAHFSYQAIGAQLFKVYQKVLA